MKDKEKQIEEMAKVMLEKMERPKCFTTATEEQDFLNAYYLAFIVYATHLYNAGYRKIPEGAVVLTRKDREEFNELYRSALQRAEKWEKLCGIKIKETRKETAEKILKGFSNLNKLIKSSALNSVIQAFEKQFDVYIKE